MFTQHPCVNNAPFLFDRNLSNEYFICWIEEKAREVFKTKPAVVLNKDPYIAYYEDFLSPKTCQEVIQLAKSRLQPSKVLKPSGIEKSPVRTSESASLPHHSHPMILNISSKIAAIVGQPLQFAEPLQVIRYQKGGKFAPHFDSYDLHSYFGRTQALKKGQRLFTAILYLNTVTGGGETAFPLLKLAVTPVQGSLLVFENCKKGTNKTHPFSLHESRPVIIGEKWIGVLWFRDKSQYEGGNE